MNSIASSIRRDIRHFGVARTAYSLFMKGINLIVDLRIIRAFKAEVVDPHFLQTNDEFQWRFLNEGEMLALIHNPHGKQPERFVRTALAKGDNCYGGFDDEQLVCFAWYSNQPTDDEGLTFRFKPEYMYVHSGFTHPKYRGQRLTISRGNRARHAFLERGFKGEVFTIDSHNFRSLRSLAGLGIQEIGYIFALRIGKQVWTRASRGCREHGISLAKPSATPVVSCPELGQREIPI